MNIEMMKINIGNILFQSFMPILVKLAIDTMTPDVLEEP